MEAGGSGIPRNIPQPQTGFNLGNFNDPPCNNNLSYLLMLQNLAYRNTILNNNSNMDANYLFNNITSQGNLLNNNQQTRNNFTNTTNPINSFDSRNTNNMWLLSKLSDLAQLGAGSSQNKSNIGPNKIGTAEKQNISENSNININKIPNIRNFNNLNNVCDFRNTSNLNDPNIFANLNNYMNNVNSNNNNNPYFATNNSFNENTKNKSTVNDNNFTSFENKNELVNKKRERDNKDEENGLFESEEKSRNANNSADKINSMGCKINVDQASLNSGSPKQNSISEKKSKENPQQSISALSQNAIKVKDHFLETEKSMNLKCELEKYQPEYEKDLIELQASSLHTFMKQNFPETYRIDNFYLHIKQMKERREKKLKTLYSAEIDKTTNYDVYTKLESSDEYSSEMNSISAILNTELHCIWKPKVMPENQSKYFYLTLCSR
jgi:hypothetical protein